MNTTSNRINKQNPRMKKYIRYLLLPIFVVLLIFTGTCLISSADMPNVPSGLPWDKVVHFGMFFVLSFVNFVDYYKLCDGKPPMWRWIMWGFVLPVFYGALIEILQGRYFGRSGEWLDLAADIAGSASAMALILFTHKLFTGKEKKVSL